MSMNNLYKLIQCVQPLNDIFFIFLLLFFKDEIKLSRILSLEYPTFKFSNFTKFNNNEKSLIF